MAPPVVASDPLAQAWADTEGLSGEMASQEAWNRAQAQMQEALSSAWGNGDEAGIESAWANIMQQAGQEGFAGFDSMDGQLDKAWSQLQTANPLDQPYDLAKVLLFGYRGRVL